jgi:phage/plasmid-associated DNA primase
MTRVLGQYKGTVPISLVTQKRTTIGNTSSEIYQLIGTRYAVMQEPSKGDVINEGVMKEITGGDPIVCRALFKDSVTFIPQFKLAVCTNNLFDIKSNDDGTWRRIRVVNFESKFTLKPYNDPEFPVESYPHQFMLDTTLDEKFDVWAPVMLSLLVERAYETQGKVADCPEVLASSNRYRQSQDIYLDFINQCIQEHSMPQPCNLKITAITDCFKNWYSINHGGKTMPLKELKEYLSKKFGSHSKEGWSRLSLIEGEG